VIPVEKVDAAMSTITTGSDFPTLVVSVHMTPDRGRPPTHHLEAVTLRESGGDVCMLCGDRADVAVRLDGLKCLALCEHDAWRLQEALAIVRAIVRKGL
jgi:hypothetical protein